MYRARSSTVFAGLALVLALAGCNSERHGRAPEGEQKGAQTETTQGGKKTLTVKGSDTMVILAQRWAEAYMKKNPDVSIQVSGGGSGTGIAALINGTTDIADASRKMKDEEKKTVEEKRGAPAVETPVALDALAVYVNDNNPVKSLSFPQLKKIYRGEAKNWKEVGGPDLPITLYGRENNSGTYVFFKEHVLDDLDYAPQTQTLPGTAAVINAVAKDKGGIGYGGIGYAEGIRTVPITKEEGGQAVEPTMENAVGGTYPLARFLYVYTAGQPEGRVADYVKFMLSPDGQKVVDGAGYYPLPDKKAGEGDGNGNEPDSEEATEGQAG